MVFYSQWFSTCFVHKIYCSTRLTKWEPCGIWDTCENMGHHDIVKWSNFMFVRSRFCPIKTPANTYKLLDAHTLVNEVSNDLFQPMVCHMMTSSNGNIFCVTGHLCREFTGHRSLHKGQWRGALMFSLICAWINCWVNNGEAGDLRCCCTHYDVIVMTDGRKTHHLKQY